MPHCIRWTATKPAIEGFYYVEIARDLSGGTYVTVVHVYDSKQGLLVFWDGSNYALNDACDAFIRWSTRIPDVMEENWEHDVEDENATEEGSKPLGEVRGIAKEPPLGDGICSCGKDTPNHFGD